MVKKEGIMKKILTLFLMMLLGGCLLLSQSITITSPSAGDKYKFGDTIAITWTSSGITGDVKITLWDNSSSTGKIIMDPCPYNASPFLYTIPSGAQAGDYFIRIKHATSNVAKASGVFSIEPDVDLLYGQFSISKVTCTASNKKLAAVNILVDYTAQKDFVLCKSIKGKCSADLGSMVVTYKLKNYTWSGGQAVADETTGCNYACLKSCGTLYYPTAVQKAGKGSFIITMYPKTYNDLSGVRNQYCIATGWGKEDWILWDDYFPELTVTLTMCISYDDPPKSFQYQMISDTSSAVTIYLAKADMTVVGSTSCGW
jgi:hypothetical protein